MTTIPNGAYAYYTDRSLPPIVCEVQHNWVWEVGDGHHRHVSKHHGEFIRLQEVTCNEPNQATHGDTTQG